MEVKDTKPAEPAVNQSPEDARPGEIEFSASPIEAPPLARLAGAFLLAAAMFGVAAIVAFGTYGRNTPYGWAFAVLAGLLLGAWSLGRAQSEQLPRDSFARQRTLLGINAVSSVLLLLVLLVGANYIAARRNKTFDLTKNKVNSLAPQSYESMEKLPAPVAMTYVYLGRVDPAAQALLDTYDRSGEKVSVEYVNFLREPARAPQGFSGQPVLVLQINKPVEGAAQNAVPVPGPAERQEVSVVDEQNVTSALIKLTNPKESTVYFLTGHGEAEPSQLGAAQTALAAQNYSLKTVSLLRAGAKVPADAAALLIAAPQADISAAESKALTSYVNGKGRLVILLSPARTRLPRWEAFLKTLGLTAQSGNYVFDLEQNAGSPQIPVGVRGDTNRHALLRGVSADVILPAAVPLKAASPAPAGITLTPVFESAANSQSVSPNGQQGGPGPFTLAAAIEKGGSRILVSSSAGFATDQLLNQYGNQSFLLSAVNWTVGNDALVSIPPRQQQNNTLSMPAPTMRFTSLFSLLVLPFVILLTGAVVWWKRR